MSDLHKMKVDRQMAVRAMQNMGWHAERSKKGKTAFWTFKRPDTGGLWDSTTIRQEDLSMDWVAAVAMNHGDAPELSRCISKARTDWLKNRFLGIYREFSEATP